MYLGTPAKVKSGLPQLWVRLPGAKSELKKLGNALNQALLLNPDMEGVGLQLVRLPSARACLSAALKDLLQAGGEVRSARDTRCHWPTCFH